MMGVRYTSVNFGADERERERKKEREREKEVRERGEGAREREREMKRERARESARAYILSLFGATGGVQTCLHHYLDTNLFSV